MIILPDSFWILFVIIIFCFIIKEAKNGLSHSLNPEKVKRDLEDSQNRSVWRSALNISTVYAKRL